MLLFSRALYTVKNLQNQYVFKKSYKKITQYATFDINHVVKFVE